MSAGLNTVAGTLYEDFEQYVLRGKRQSEAQQSFAMKVIVLVLGVVFILLVLVVEKLGALFQVGFLSCWPTFYVPDVPNIFLKVPFADFFKHQTSFIFGM